MRNGLSISQLLKSSVIRNATINIVDVDTLSGCYYIEPYSLVMGGLVGG